jgi:carbon storage regulator CsrA
MLVLSRRKGQEIRIGHDITVKVLQTGRTVKIGIDAPRHVRVLRGEVEPAAMAAMASCRTSA